MQDSKSRKGWGPGRLFRTLGRLSRDNAGNTLAMVGAALIPITAMIGSGVDISRAYMAKSRLQSACDASSLAARRVMKNDTLNSDVTDTGTQFFNFNFPQGLYETSSFTPTITKPGAGLIHVEAETTIPTTIMALFGFNSLPLSVECEASLNFVNTDVVLVLDVTGSMDDPIGGVKKIDSLRNAVMALYDELAPVQTQLQSQGLRLRYGIVPYSTTVNVGRLLYKKNSDYIRSDPTYQSRVANYTTADYPANTPTSASAWEYYDGSSGAGLPNSTTKVTNTGTCSSWVTAGVINGGGPKPAATTASTHRGSTSTAGYVEATNWGWSGAYDTGGTDRSCRRWTTTTTTTYSTVYKFTDWTYRRVDNIDTSTFNTATGTISLATGNSPAGTSATSRSYNMQELATLSGVAKGNYTWNGCIEERLTTPTITASSGFTIPSGAHDLNINEIPGSKDTRWSPMLSEATYRRTAGSVSANSGTNVTGACPYEAAQLTEWTRDAMDTYVKKLAPTGGTYLDVGMIWGARLISTGGVFADGCEEYNNMPCNRHIIFMTDGAQTAYCDSYTAYGLEYNDARVMDSPVCNSPSNYTNDIPDDNITKELLARHKQRFNMICNATKNLNVSVWVVAFATNLTTNLTNCASNSSQAKTSANQAELIKTFKEIGNQIGALRLTE